MLTLHADVLCYVAFECILTIIIIIQLKYVPSILIWMVEALQMQYRGFRFMYVMYALPMSKW